MLEYKKMMKAKSGWKSMIVKKNKNVLESFCSIPNTPDSEKKITPTTAIHTSIRLCISGHSVRIIGHPIHSSENVIVKDTTITQNIMRSSYTRLENAN